jgi:hypothetical protein
MDQEREDYADVPGRGRPWTGTQVIILGVVVCLSLFLIGVALEVARVVHWGTLFD